MFALSPFVLSAIITVMNITVITMFPDQFDSFRNHPLVARAAARGQLSLRILDLKNYADGSYRHIDDSPYGGGAGMILRCEPVFRALRDVKTEASHVIAFTPSGTTYTQMRAKELSEETDLVLLCGHYEAFDERILSAVDEELSVGDYILSGGELPAMTVIDSIVRLLDGTLKPKSTEEESFEDGLLEYPQYTHPYDFEGMKVPDVLLSGHAEKIRIWKRREALRKTFLKRPDLLKTAALTQEDDALLKEIKHEEGSMDRN